MKLYLGVTDYNWYKYLHGASAEDVNFWQPAGNTSFKVLSPGAPFLFKLKNPYNSIGGVGFFSSQTKLPMNMAWDVFANRNGCGTYAEFRNMIFQYRKDKENTNPIIGCIVLTNPIFFEREDWISIPPDWSKSIVQGKSYDTTTEVGGLLWERVEHLLEKYLQQDSGEGVKSQLTLEAPEERYGITILRKVRLGQGAFRVLITDVYNRRCSITGEKTLPVLEAAHIKPYAESGPHFISNGLLLRSDMHKLFDSGYITITKDYKVEVSRKIAHEFENGKEYYQYHGKDLRVLPQRDRDKPNERYINWHNESFKG